MALLVIVNKDFGHEISNREMSNINKTRNFSI